MAEGPVIVAGNPLIPAGERRSHLATRAAMATRPVQFTNLSALPLTLRFLAAIVPRQGGKEMMRSLSLIVIGAVCLFTLGTSHSANEGTFQIGDWVGRAHWNQKDKRLDRCSAQLTNPDGITMIYSLDRHYMWTFELSSPSWNFPKGAVFEVGFGTGSGGFVRQHVTALYAQLVRVQLSDSLSAFEAFRKMLRLELVAGGLTSAFDMVLVDQVLTTLTRCVAQQGATPKTRAAIAAWL